MLEVIGNQAYIAVTFVVVAMIWLSVVAAGITILFIVVSGAFVACHLAFERLFGECDGCRDSRKKEETRVDRVIHRHDCEQIAEAAARRVILDVVEREKAMKRGKWG